MCNSVERSATPKSKVQSLLTKNTVMKAVIIVKITEEEEKEEEEGHRMFSWFLPLQKTKTKQNKTKKQPLNALSVSSSL